jgi:pyruvate-formate lyase-activating enzyme
MNGEPSVDPLDLVPKLYQASLAGPLAEIVSAKQPDAPFVVELDPTSFCDLGCPECISSPLLNSGRFTKNRLREISRELVELRVRAVILIGGGEPLLHAAIHDVFEILGAGGVAIGLTTNGTQLGRHCSVVATYCAWTRVSVDAATRDTYGRFRPARSGRNLFDHVIANMRALAAEKVGALGYSFLVMTRVDSRGNVIDSNISEIAAAARLARDIGCDYFEVKPEYDIRHYLKKQDDLLLQLRDQVSQAAELTGPGFSVLPQKNLTVLDMEGSLVQPKAYTSCNVAELRTLITSSGAYVCPYHRGNAEARYGDPTSESMASMWQGRSRAEAMGRINPATACRFHCIRHESNLEIIRLSRNSGHLVPVVPDYDLFI